VFCIYHRSRKDKIKNNINKQKIIVTQSLLAAIKTKQLQWYGHVERMEEGRLPKEAMKWRPPGRKKRVRPKLNIHVPVGFEPTISAGERPQIYALDRAATGTGK
jgi:hypothetical protein